MADNHDNSERDAIVYQEKFFELYDRLRDGVASVDSRGRITHCNRQFQEMTGYTLAELKGLSYEDITPCRWHAKEQEILENQVKVKGYSDLYEKEYIRKDGLIIPVELQTYLVKDHAGLGVGF